MTEKRTAPLTAPVHPDAHDAVVAEHADLESSVAAAASQLPATERDRRDARFTEGVRTLRIGGANIQLSERILLVLAAIVAPLGLIAILLGYVGVASTPYPFEQNSYLISGGLFGLALVFLGSFFYFAHWLTQLVKEHRVQSTAMLEAIQRLQDEVARQTAGPVPVGASTNGHHADDVPLVATARGTMAHGAGCVVVAGKQGLRAVSEADGLTPCKLCEPYGGSG